MTRIGSDTGGTFTDLVTADGTIAKIPSTPQDPGRAVRDGLAQLAGSRADTDEIGTDAEVLTHGTTVATNALLEAKGAVVALVTTAGFADVVEIARQDRPSLYDNTLDRPEPLVTRSNRLELAERVSADGEELLGLAHGWQEELIIAPDVEAVAICLLHSDLDPTHERVVAEALREAGNDVSASHEISPEFREYERTVTTVLNAYLRPVCRSYLLGLSAIGEADGRPLDVLAMSSAGGLVPAATAAEQPVRLLLSGPAGGVLAGAAVAEANGFCDAVTFDMGGTSTDVCLVRGGQPEPASERRVGGYPVRLPSLDVHTIGAGGGSIARLDPGGALVVGPQSAGAVPGPACYGRGGELPTVTDADLVLGRIPAGHGFSGLGRLDLQAAERAIESAGLDAAGIVTVIDAAMVEAVRAVTVERGIDPRGLALVAFGGAGPLHACAIAEALGMAAVVVPPRAGVLSAVGILCAPRQVDLVESWPEPLDHAGASAELERLAQRSIRELGGAAEPHVEVRMDCRYAGQSHEIAVGSVAAFGPEHRRRNGYERPGTAIEVVALRASARTYPPVSVLDLEPPERAGGAGPVVLAEHDCTIWVPAGWSADVGEAGALVLRRRAHSA